ncbi:MAG: hypothetical protein ACREGD_02405 [Candidatus Saccharimonadales bacterium]
MAGNQLRDVGMQSFVNFAPATPEVTDRQVDPKTALAALSMNEVQPFGADLMTPAAPKPGELHGERNTPHTTCIVQGHGKNTYRMTDDD